MIVNSIFTDPLILDINYPSNVDGISFISCNCKIIGTMHIAQGIGPHPTVILLHGIPGYEQNFDIAHALLKNGYNVLVFHYRGNWGCEGSYSLKHVLEDTENAIEFLKTKQSVETYRIDINKIILIGHSLGGFTALMAAAKHPEIKLVASIAAFNFGMFGEMLLKNPALLEVAVNYFSFICKPVIQGTTPYEFLKQVIDNNEQWNLFNIIQNLKGHSVLFVGGTRDTDVPVEEHYKPILECLKKEKVSVRDILLDANHSFSDKKIALAQEILSWLEDEL